MSVQDVNGHVLLPHPPNWRTQPEWSRTWENEIVPAVTGHETRSALRSLPRVSLSWLVTPWGNIQQNKLDDQIREAKKTGLACAPYWGRASVLAIDCSGNAAVLQSTFWPWKVGDWAYFLHPLTSFDFELRQVTAVAGSTLTLDAPVSMTYSASSLVWPLLFGKMTCKDMTLATDLRGSVQLTLQEETPAQAQQLGEVSTSPGGGGSDGIGSMEIGSTFVVS